MSTSSYHDIRFEYLGDNPAPEVPIFTIILLSFIGHTIVFYCLPTRIQPLTKSYIISTIHAVVGISSVCIFLSRYTVNLRQVNRIAGGGVKGTGDEMMAYSLCYSIGYFCYDFFLMLIHKSVRTTSALIHHLIIIAGLLSGILGKVGHPCHFYLLIEELSTIPLNLKSIFHHRPRLHHILSVMFALTFLSSRLIYGTIICGYTFLAAPRFIELALRVNDTTSLIFVGVQTILCLSLRCLNFYWGILIVRKLSGTKKEKPPIFNGESKTTKVS